MLSVLWRLCVDLSMVVGVMFMARDGMCIVRSMHALGAILQRQDPVCVFICSAFFFFSHN